MHENSVITSTTPPPATHLPLSLAHQSQKKDFYLCLCGCFFTSKEKSDKHDSQKALSQADRDRGGGGRVLHWTVYLRAMAAFH